MLTINHYILLFSTAWQCSVTCSAVCFVCWQCNMCLYTLQAQLHRRSKSMIAEAVDSTLTILDLLLPMQWGRYLFMHNGVIGGFMGLRRALLASLSEVGDRQ